MALYPERYICNGFEISDFREMVWERCKRWGLSVSGLWEGSLLLSTKANCVQAMKNDFSLLMETRFRCGSGMQYRGGMNGWRP